MKNSAQQHRRQAPARSRRSRPALFAALALGVLALAGYYLKQGFFGPTPAPMAGNVIDVAANMGGFDKKSIRVKAGEPVTIRLTSLDNRFHSDGGGKHQWAVDELKVNIIAPSLGSSYATFTPSKPGTYTFYCDICCGGRANPTMSGRFVVAL